MYAITDQLSKHLTKARYRIRTGEQLGAQPIRFVASKTKFVLPVLALMSTHIVVMEKDQAKPHDVDNLFETGFKLAKRINWIPLLRGMQFGYSVIPLIIGRNPSSDLLLYVASPPKPHWSLFGLPVVIDLTERQVAFFEGNRKLGGMIWPILQKIVMKHIEPVLDEEENPELNQRVRLD